MKKTRTANLHHLYHEPLPENLKLTPKVEVDNVHQRQTTDVYEHALTITAWQQIYDQLHPGKFHGEFTEILLDDKEGSKKSERVGVLPKGAAAQVIEQQGDWTKITSGSVEGYVKSDLLVFGEEAKHLYEESYGSQGTVTASSLRVRKEPSMDAGQIGSMKQGSRVEILGQEGDWYQVSCGEDSAYMFAEYIQIEETTALSVAEYETQQKEKEQAVQQVSQTGASMSASDSELALLAAIIQCEAGGESHTGKVAVGAVIMNRVRSSQFPNSITEVVYQSGQFSPVASGILSSVLSQGARSDCYQAAQEALAGSNPIGSALYFNSGSGRGQQIGNQHFY